MAIKIVRSNVERMLGRQDLLLDILTKAAKSGLAMPTRKALGQRVGTTKSGASVLLHKMEARGIIELQRAHMQSRVRIVSLDLWTAWEVQDKPAPVQSAPQTRSTSSHRTPAQREVMARMASPIRRALPPITSEADAARAIAEAIDAGRVTRCPPRAVAQINQGFGFEPPQRQEP